MRVYYKLLFIVAWCLMVDNEVIFNQKKKPVSDDTRDRQSLLFNKLTYKYSA